jgi:predicted acetyltransferase
MDEIEIRPVEVHERRAASDAFRVALVTGKINDEFFEQATESWEEGDWLAAWDAGRCVANVGAFRFDTTVPGGERVATAGYSRVGVLPTHTRRGLLTQLMTRSLVEAAGRGQVLASLRASEAPIYGRFGFGLAGDFVSAHITAHRTRPMRGTPAHGTMRLLAMDEVLTVVPPLYDRVARRRVGTIGRPAWMWQRYLKGATKPTDTPFGKGEFVAVHSDGDGVDDGYVHYEVEFLEDFATNPTAAGEIHDVWGATDAVELALWRYLFEIDLVTTWKAGERPVDDAIRRAIHDSRAYETRQVIDEQWLRILDVDAALTARTYGPANRSVVVGVVDPLFADNVDRWSINGDGAKPTTAPADLTVDIATLSATYLGGVTWSELAASGVIDITATSADTLAVLDAMFAVRPATFCGSFF